MYVYLNGPGCFQTLPVNQIQGFRVLKQELRSTSSICHTKIAISLGGCEQAENGQFMYHKPSGRLSGNEDAIASGLKYFKIYVYQYKAYARQKQELQLK
jgi:hypothetical protein